MRTPTISDTPLLIGKLIKRFEEQQAKGCWWKRLLGLERRPVTHVVKIGPSETILSDRFSNR
jgi:hypothetical protein